MVVVVALVDCGFIVIVVVVVVVGDHNLGGGNIHNLVVVAGAVRFGNKQLHE